MILCYTHTQESRRYSAISLIMKRHVTKQVLQLGTRNAFKLTAGSE